LGLIGCGSNLEGKGEWVKEGVHLITTHDAQNHSILSGKRGKIYGAIHQSHQKPTNL